jgi:hypothetical protein
LLYFVGRVLGRTSDTSKVIRDHAQKLGIIQKD